MPSEKALKEHIDTFSPLGYFAALIAIASQPVWAPKPLGSQEQVAVLTQRVNALETYFVTLDSRERQSSSALMLMLTDLKSAISRIEGKLEK